MYMCIHDVFNINVCIYKMQLTYIYALYEVQGHDHPVYIVYIYNYKVIVS